MKVDVAIIGAGPAGLCAAHELIYNSLEAGKKLDVLMIDAGKPPLARNKDEEIKGGHLHWGVGGAGTFSDGKFNITPKIGFFFKDEEKSTTSFYRDINEVQRYIDIVDKIFTRYGIPAEPIHSDPEKVKELTANATKEGIHFEYAPQKHVGTDELPTIIDRFYQDLISKGVKFTLETHIEEIEKSNEGFILKNNLAETIEAKYVIAAPGRAGSKWLRGVAEKLDAKYNYGTIDVGVRVEFPHIIYSEIERAMYDAKFIFRTGDYDDLMRTFCTNPRGYVVKESHEGYVLVNGHAKAKEKSDNTNFALLNTIKLTKPVADSTKYGASMAKLATTIGGGKPIIQRLADLDRHRRSTPESINKSTIVPTLKDATPGDITMAMSYRLTTNILQAIEKLDLIIPGLYSDNTLLYCLEVKFYDTEHHVNKNMESKYVENLFFVGDGSGHTRGLMPAGVTGIIPVPHILEDFGIKVKYTI